MGEDDKKCIFWEGISGLLAQGWGNLWSKRVTFSRVGENVVKAGYFFSGGKFRKKIETAVGFITSFASFWNKLQKGKVGFFLWLKGFFFFSEVGFFAVEAGYVWIFLTLSEAADFSSMGIFGLLAQGWEKRGQSGLLFRGLGKT